MYSRVPTADDGADDSGAQRAPASVPNSVEPQSLLHRFMALLHGPANKTPAEMARAFVSDLKRRAAADLPDFQLSSFQEALALGRRDCRPVLMYLHSELHPDKDLFVRQTLSDPAFRQLITSANLVTWAGSVHATDGYEAAARVEASGFPFLGLFTSSASGAATQYERVWVHEGFGTAQEVTSSLQPVVAALRGRLDAQRAERIARQSEVQLREEQERSYAEAVERDRQRIREREEARRKEEEARAAEAAAKARAEEEAELAAAIKLSTELDVAGALQQCKRRLEQNPEPDNSVPSGEVTVLRFTLPTGAKLQRRFRATDTLSLVTDYVRVAIAELNPTSSQGGAAIKSEFDLSTSFPKKTYDTHTPGSAHLSQTLQEAGLHPQAVLFVGPPMKPK